MRILFTFRRGTAPSTNYDILKTLRSEIKSRESQIGQSKQASNVEHAAQVW